MRTIAFVCFILGFSSLCAGELLYQLGVQKTFDVVAIAGDIGDISLIAEGLGQAATPRIVGLAGLWAFGVLGLVCLLVAGRRPADQRATTGHGR